MENNLIGQDYRNLGKLNNLRAYPTGFSEDDGGLTERKAMEVNIKIKLLNCLRNYKVVKYIILPVLVLYVSIFIYFCLFLKSIFKNLIFIVVFPLPFSPVTLPPSNHHPVVHVHESCSLSAQVLLLFSAPPQLAVILLSIYESVPIFFISSVCSFSSTYERNHTAYVQRKGLRSPRSLKRGVAATSNITKHLETDSAEIPALLLSNKQV